MHRDKPSLTQEAFGKMTLLTSPGVSRLLRHLLLACLVSSSLSWAATKTQPPPREGQTVALNFVNADIGAVIQSISKISGRNFIIDPRVKGTINIVTSTPVDKELTYSILLSALRLQGYSVIEEKSITKVVPEADAKLHASPVSQRSSTGDRVTTRVYVLKHESAAQIVPIIRPLVTPNNTVAAYPGNNTLVITDYAENLERIARIVESIDVPQGDVRFIPLRHALASDLAITINRLMNDGNAAAAMGGVPGDNSQRLTVVADTRSNSLLIRSENPSKINAVRQLVGNLDQPGAAGNIHVIYLKNAEAVRVAQVLRAILAKDPNSSMPQPSTAAFAPPAPTTTGQGNPPPGVSTPPSSPPPLGGGSSLGSNTTDSGITGGMIQADPMSNALIITAPDAVYNNLRGVVEQLDRRRAQIYIEALVAEVSTDKAAEIGIQWQAGKLGSNAFGGTNFTSGNNNILNLSTGLLSSTAPALPGTGLNMILGNGALTIGGRQIANLNTVARFLESDSRANILSTPNLVTLDNEEAKIVVGRNLPFVTGQYTTNTSGGSTVGNPFQTIERRDVGLTLKVKPQISEGGTVKLQIYQEASTVSNSVGIPGLSDNSGPVTNKRSIESTVLVEDGSMVALGGLVEDTYSTDAEKVPVLGDLPVLGGLFRYESRKRAKTNLIVFLRPVILRDGASFQGLSNERYDYILGQQRTLEQPQSFDPPVLPNRRDLAPAPVQAERLAENPASTNIVEPNGKQ